MKFITESIKTGEIVGNAHYNFVKNKSDEDVDSYSLDDKKGNRIFTCQVYGKSIFAISTGNNIETARKALKGLKKEYNITINGIKI